MWVRTSRRKEVGRTVGNKNNLEIEIRYRRDSDGQVQQPVPRKKSSTENSRMLQVRQTLHRNVMGNKMH